jgi:RNA polymerase sigma-70 factor, ECF subfamily
MVIAKLNELTDQELVDRVIAGEKFLFEMIMRRYNQRLFRVAKSILKDGDEAEDVVQDAYVRAYTHLHQFAGHAKFSTWLTKIAVYESLARLRRSRRLSSLDGDQNAEEIMMIHKGEAADNPQKDYFRRTMIDVLEHALQAIPEKYRVVIVLRDSEGLSTEETALSLGISEEAVKTRLHRARMLLRKQLESNAGITLKDVYAFAGARCDRIVANVMQTILQL